MVGSKVFLMKWRQQFIYPSKKNEFMVPNQEKKGDYQVNLCLPHLIDKFWLKKIMGSKVFLMKPKYQYHLSQSEEYVYDAHLWKEKRLLRESMFILIEIHTSIHQLVTREVFLLKPKHQYN